MPTPDKGTRLLIKAFEALDSTARKYRHKAHSVTCQCSHCREFLKAVVRHEDELAYALEILKRKPR